ncbi:hypothetical protein FACS1894126_6430 [Alphaproteobacteria bacterium]|nr:hypothetical protein FACS1894126_6430 [Alphaproteobacteria bacterium]
MALLYICSKIDAYEKSKENHKSKGSHFVSIREGCIYENDAEIINKEANLQLAIFRVLLHACVDEFFSGEKKYVNVQQIYSALKAEGIFLENPEEQIGRSIYYIRASIKSVHKNLGTNSIIESKKWKGYRINDGVFLERFRAIG